MNFYILYPAKGEK